MVLRECRVNTLACQHIIQNLEEEGDVIGYPKATSIDVAQRFQVQAGSHFSRILKEPDCTAKSGLSKGWLSWQEEWRVYYGVSITQDSRFPTTCFQPIGLPRYRTEAHEAAKGSGTGLWAGGSCDLVEVF